MKKIIMSLSLAVTVTLLLMALPQAETFAQAQKSGSMEIQKWEYRVVTFSSSRGQTAGDVESLRARNKDSEKALNELGAEGWELVAVRENPSRDPVYYFKRPLK